MAEFAVVDETCTPLWDFGWFSQTRFTCSGASAAPRAVLDALFRSPLFPRWFCTSPDPWGAAIPNHGPSSVASLTERACVELSDDELELRIRSALDDPSLRPSPSLEQREPVERWISAVRAAGMSAFELDHRAPSVEEHESPFEIFSIFREFIAIAPDRSELWIAVIGMD